MRQIKGSRSGSLTGIRLVAKDFRMKPYYFCCAGGQDVGGYRPARHLRLRCDAEDSGGAADGAANGHLPGPPVIPAGRTGHQVGSWAASGWPWSCLPSPRVICWPGMMLLHRCTHFLPATANSRTNFGTIRRQALCMLLIAKSWLRPMFRHHGSSSQCQDITESVLRLCSCCVEQSPGSQASVGHLLADHMDLVNWDLPSWVHAHIYSTHLLDFLGEKRHHKVSDLN